MFKKVLFLSLTLISSSRCADTAAPLSDTSTLPLGKQTPAGRAKFLYLPSDVLPTASKKIALSCSKEQVLQITNTASAEAKDVATALATKQSISVLFEHPLKEKSFVLQVTFGATTAQKQNVKPDIKVYGLQPSCPAPVEAFVTRYVAFLDLRVNALALGGVVATGTVVLGLALKSLVTRRTGIDGASPSGHAPTTTTTSAGAGNSADEEPTPSQPLAGAGSSTSPSPQQAEAEDEDTALPYASPTTIAEEAINAFVEIRVNKEIFVTFRELFSYTFSPNAQLTSEQIEAALKKWITGPQTTTLVLTNSEYRQIRDNLDNLFLPNNLRHRGLILNDTETAIPGPHTPVWEGAIIFGTQESEKEFGYKDGRSASKIRAELSSNASALWEKYKIELYQPIPPVFVAGIPYSRDDAHSTITAGAGGGVGASSGAKPTSSPLLAGVDSSTPPSRRPAGAGVGVTAFPYASPTTIAEEAINALVGIGVNKETFVTYKEVFGSSLSTQAPQANEIENAISGWIASKTILVLSGNEYVYENIAYFIIEFFKKNTNAKMRILVLNDTKNRSFLDPDLDTCWMKHIEDLSCVIASKTYHLGCQDTRCVDNIRKDLQSKEATQQLWKKYIETLYPAVANLSAGVHKTPVLYYGDE